MIPLREALAVSFALAGGAFNALSAGAAVAGETLEQVANAFSASDGVDLDLTSTIELCADEIEVGDHWQPMGFRA